MVLCDSRSALEALKSVNKPTKLVSEVVQIFWEVSTHIRISLHRVKAHDGNLDNERADQLAKEAAHKQAETGYTRFPRKALRSALHKRTFAEWQNRWSRNTVGNWTKEFITLVSAQARELNYEYFQLITGHGNFNTFLRKLAAGRGDAGHLLIACRLEQRARE